MHEDFPYPDPEREAFRAKRLAMFPAWLHPGALLAVEILILAAAAAAGFSRARWGWGAAIFIPAAFAFGNIFEWAIHRGHFHHPWPPKLLYTNHTRLHHRYYQEGNMRMRSPRRELQTAMLTPLGILPLVAAGGLVAAGIGALFGANAGWLFFAMENVYILAYELAHVSFHLPESHPLSRTWYVRVVGELHRRHHDPRLMRKNNFNVVFPLGDWLFRTRAPKESKPTP